MGELYKKINKKILLLVLAAIIFGGLAFWLSSREEKIKNSQPEEQVKIFLKTVQKGAPDFFTYEAKNIQTPEILKLQEKNKELQATFAQSRIKDIDDLKQKIGDVIQHNWLGWGKTDADRGKIKQVEFLEGLATEPYQPEKVGPLTGQGPTLDKLALLSQLKNSNHFRTYYDEKSQTSREVLPSLTYQNKKLTTADTPYETALPQKDAPEIKFNQKYPRAELSEFPELSSRSAETLLTFTLKNSTLNNPKVYDNRALYGEIKKGIDQLLTAQSDGLTQSFIIKNPLSLEIQGDSGLLTLEYDLTTSLTAAEDKGAIIINDQKQNKQYVLTPPAFTDIQKQTPGEVKFKLTQSTENGEQNTENSYQLQIEVKVTKAAAFPLLISYNILPALTRYVK